jgi:Oxidoreductase family, C-terminal alpha/beta domain
MADFPSGHTMIVAGSTANEQGLETMIRGHKANMYLGGSEIIIRPERTFAEEIEESRTPAPGGESTDEHFHDFFRCVRSREKPHCNIDLAYRVHVTVGLAEIAFRQNKIMRFDPKKVEVI